MFYRLQHAFQRWRFSDSAAGTPLQPLYDQPLIPATQTFLSTRFLVLDCEMSGLDTHQCQLLSIGWVMIENARIINASGRHLLIHADQGGGDSSKIHGLLDSSIAGAMSAAAVLILLIRQMQGAVLVFHHAPVDIRFLQKTTLENLRCPLLFPYVDTMELEARRLRMRGKHAGLRLPQCRERYGLPVCQQHNALADAQATAELLLAQASYLGEGRTLQLSDMGLRCVM